jgi:hypothetical protein
MITSHVTQTHPCGNPRSPSNTRVGESLAGRAQTRGREVSARPGHAVPSVTVCSAARGRGKPPGAGPVRRHRSPAGGKWGGGGLIGVAGPDVSLQRPRVLMSHTTERDALLLGRQLRLFLCRHSPQAGSIRVSSISCHGAHTCRLVASRPGEPGFPGRAGVRPAPGQGARTARKEAAPPIASGNPSPLWAVAAARPRQRAGDALILRGVGSFIPSAIAWAVRAGHENHSHTNDA